MTLAFAIILAVALLGCSMALALSVWARKPHEVVLVTYTFWILVLLFWPIWFALVDGRACRLRHPGPSWPIRIIWRLLPIPCRAGSDFWDYLGFFAAALGASVASTVLAVWRMRPVAAGGM